MKEKIIKHLDSIAIALFCAVFFTHWGILSHFAYDLPFADEWTYFISGRPNTIFSFDWILEFHNEHRTFFTRLLYTINYHLFGMDFSYQVIFNFSLVGLILLGVYKLFRGVALSPFLILIFLVFSLGDAAFNNYHWGIQSNLHGFILFFVWALVVFRQELTGPRALLGFALLLMSMLSLSSGVVCALTCASMLLLREILVSWDHRNFKRKAFFYSLIIFISILLSILLWLQNYPGIQSVNPSYTLPWHSRFWSYLSALLSWLFGVKARSDFWSTIALFSFIVACVQLLKRYKSFAEDKNFWAVTTWTLGILASLCAITLGRGGFGTPQAKSSRYYEIVIMLLPVVVYGFTQFKTKKASTYAITGLWLLCFLGHLGNWNLVGIYRSIRDDLASGERCLKTNPQEICPTIASLPLEEWLNKAYELNVNFAKRIKENKE